MLRTLGVPRLVVEAGGHRVRQQKLRWHSSATAPSHRGSWLLRRDDKHHSHHQLHAHTVAHPVVLRNNKP